MVFNVLDAHHYDKAKPHDDRERDDQIVVDVERNIVRDDERVGQRVQEAFDDVDAVAFADEDGRDEDVLGVVRRHAFCKGCLISFSTKENLLEPAQIIAAHVVHDDRRVPGLLCVTDLILKRTVVSAKNRINIELHKTIIEQYLAMITANRDSVTFSGGGSSSVQPSVGLARTARTFRPLSGISLPNVAGKSRNSSRS